MSDLVRGILWTIAVLGGIAAVAGIAQDLARLAGHIRTRRAERAAERAQIGRWHPIDVHEVDEHDQAEAGR